MELHAQFLRSLSGRPHLLVKGNGLISIFIIDALIEIGHHGSLGLLSLRNLFGVVSGIGDRIPFVNKILKDFAITIRNLVQRTPNSRAVFSLRFHFSFDCLTRYPHTSRHSEFIQIGGIQIDVEADQIGHDTVIVFARSCLNLTSWLPNQSQNFVDQILGEDAVNILHDHLLQTTKEERPGLGAGHEALHFTVQSGVGNTAILIGLLRQNLIHPVFVVPDTVSIVGVGQSLKQFTAAVGLHHQESVRTVSIHKIDQEL